MSATARRAPARAEPDRTIETAIEIAASPRDVWGALTQAGELARWFPLEARVTPGPGGTIWLSWGEGSWEGEIRIDVWEPERRLRARDPGPPPPSGGTPMPLVLDMTLEGRRGSTLLRLVQSGFRSSADWEREMFEDVERGWQFELRSLRLYLERHRGRDRHVAWPRITHRLTRAEAWRRVLGERALVREGTLPLGEGAPFAILASTGDRFEGVVELVREPQILALRVTNLADALLRVELCGNEVWFWLSRWGDAAQETGAFERRWREQLELALSSG